MRSHICVVCSQLLLLLVVLCGHVMGVVIDCQRPPQLVDPALCCQEGGRDDVTENCAQRLGLTGQPAAQAQQAQAQQTQAQAPTVETATCLAECIMTQSRYMPQPEQLNFDNIRADLQRRFANDTVYVQTMVESFTKCAPSAQRKLQAFKQVPLGSAAIQRGCNPYAGIVLGCTYMEYFKNCPAHRWTENAQCALAKQFVTQCALGA